MVGVVRDWKLVYIFSRKTKNRCYIACILGPVFFLQGDLYETISEMKFCLPPKNDHLLMGLRVVVLIYWFGMRKWVFVYSLEERLQLI